MNSAKPSQLTFLFVTKCDSKFEQKLTMSPIFNINTGHFYTNYLHVKKIYVKIMLENGLNGGKSIVVVVVT